MLRAELESGKLASLPRLYALFAKLEHAIDFDAIDEQPVDLIFLLLAPEGSGTRVTWTMNGDMGRNPLYHWFALAADSMVGKDFEAGLANLKAATEH